MNSTPEPFTYTVGGRPLCQCTQRCRYKGTGRPVVELGHTLAEQLHRCLADAVSYALDLTLPVRKVEVVVQYGKTVQDLGLSFVMEARMNPPSQLALIQAPVAYVPREPSCGDDTEVCIEQLAKIQLGDRVLDRFVNDEGIVRF